MHVILSFLYAPFIVVLLNYFAIQHVALFVLSVGIVWFITIKPKVLKKVIFPFFYMAVAVVAFLMDDFVVFKFLPLLMSLSFLFFLIVSYFDNESIILQFARKIHKKPISETEEAYIKKSTLFWIFITFINIIAHITVLLLQDNAYWVIYSSFGWYFVFGMGGLIHFLHRKFIFLKRI